MKFKGLAQTSERPKNLINKLSEKSEFINVYCRIRPTEQQELINYQLTKDEITIQEQKFQFTQIFDHQETQEQVAIRIVKPIINDLVENCKKIQLEKNGLLFTYGVTNSGKSFTVSGNSDHKGLLHYGYQYLSEFLEKFRAQKINKFLYPKSYFFEDKNSEIKIIFEAFEIYNEEVYDLQNDQRTKLKVCYYDKKFFVQNLQRIIIQNNQDFHNALELVNTNRTIQKTILNNSSSRSHTIYSLILQFPKKNDLDKTQKELKLSIVDLAGSERQKRTENKGSQLKEQNSINTSLFNLDQCIRSMVWKKKNPNQQIPFRNSVLTQIFQDFFTIKNIIRMVILLFFDYFVLIQQIININPSLSDLQETLRALKQTAIAKQMEPLKTNFFQKEELINEWEKLQQKQEILEIQSKSQKKLIKLVDQLKNNEKNIQMIIWQKAVELQFLKSQMQLEQKGDQMLKDLEIDCIKEGQKLLEEFHSLYYDCLEREEDERSQQLLIYLEEINKNKKKQVEQLQIKQLLINKSCQCSPIKQNQIKTPAKSPYTTINSNKKDQTIFSCEKCKIKQDRFEQKEVQKNILNNSKQTEQLQNSKQKENKYNLINKEFNQLSKRILMVANSYRKKLRSKK